MKIFRRIVLALMLLFVAVFSVFGFLATSEPNPSSVVWPWRVGYAVLGFASLAGVLRLARSRTSAIQ